MSAQRKTPQELARELIPYGLGGTTVESARKLVTELIARERQEAAAYAEAELSARKRLALESGKLLAADEALRSAKAAYRSMAEARGPEVEPEGKSIFLDNCARRIDVATETVRTARVDLGFAMEDLRALSIDPATGERLDAQAEPHAQPMMLGTPMLRMIRAGSQASTSIYGEGVIPMHCDFTIERVEEAHGRTVLLRVNGEPRDLPTQVRAGDVVTVEET